MLDDAHMKVIPMVEMNWICDAGIIPHTEKFYILFINVSSLALIMQCTIQN